MNSLEVFIPPDRRQAIARGEPLPDRAHGSVLLADISGFTPLTDALVAELGPRQGADELAQQLNRVYDALITEVERYGGSVIFFSGDAITCWFEEKDEGGRWKDEEDSSFRLHPSALRAVACALQMQQAMQPFAALTTPSGAVVSLTIKVAISSGPVRRFLVGDPRMQLLDVLAGQTLDRMAHIEHLARKGQILAGPEVIACLGDQVQIAEWRSEEEAKAEDKKIAAVITGLTSPPSNLPTLQPSSLPTFPPSPPLTEAQARPWLLAAAYERLKAGGGHFLAELRTGVALFVSFQGLDYDHDDAAGEKLDAYIRWIQTILARYEGNILQLTIGEKGSYLYISFGAPAAHGDDASRAVATALELRHPPPHLDFITQIQIGLSQGRMRAGAYGSRTRRTYGVLGSEANIAARLMSRARPGQVLVSKHVAEAATKNFQFTYLESTTVKGRAEPIPLFEVLGRRTESPGLTPAGTAAPLSQFSPILEAVLTGQGQVLRIDSSPEIDQAPLVTTLVEQARSRGFQVARGVCQSPAQNKIYNPWREMFRDWFKLDEAPQSGDDPTGWTARQMAHVEATIAAVNSDWLPLLPLLGDLLGLPIPNNETTAIFDPLLRQGTLFALVLEMLKTWARVHPALVIIEEAHRLDEPAQGLTLALARSIASTPILLALIQPSTRPLLPELNRLPYIHQLDLSSPIEVSATHRAPSPKPAVTLAPIIGRSAERMLLAGQAQALGRGGSGGTVLIEGEAGIGKSRLVADLLEQARSQGVTCLLGGGDAIEQSTPYHAWQPIFRQLFNLEAQPQASTAGHTYVLSLLPSSPELLRLAPLLNTVLPLGLPENNLTRQMSGHVRADNTHNLLLRLLQETTTHAPMLIIIEDAHWLDSASWALARLVSQRVQRVLLVVVARPLADPLPIEYNQLLQGSNIQRLKLETLSPAETLTLVCQRLGVKSLPKPVAALIQAKAEGHPFFSEELAYALRDAGLIRVAGGECQLASDLGSFDGVVLPDTIEEVITSRLDRLNPSQQFLLKIASVIGRTFAVEILRDIHPIEADKSRLPGYLESLARLDITRLDTPEPHLAYIFKHAIIREVAYNLMLFDQRRELHRAVAEWFEQTYTGDLLPFYSLLAHHWSQAVGSRLGGMSVAKALDYLEKAGEQALRSYANQEAVRFLGQAVAISDSYFKIKQGRRGAREQGRLFAPAPLLPRSSTLLRRSRWERQLGEAYLGLGQLAESREHLERAVTLLGWPQPTQRIRQAAGLLGQLVRQAAHRLRPARLTHPDPERQAILLEAARTYERLGEIHYWSNETLLAIYAALRTLNLAERAGPSPELARAYANMCLAAGFASFHSLAEAYSRRAQAAAQAAQHEPALAWVLELTGVYAVGAGRWAIARDTLQQGTRVAQGLEDRRRWEECATALADIAYFQGDFNESLRLWLEVSTSARRRGDPQAQSWGLAGELRSLLALGQEGAEQAQTTLETLGSVVHEDIGSADKINSYGIMALLYWRLGQRESAQSAVEAGLQWMAQSSPTGFGIIHGYSNVAEVCLALYEAEEGLEVGDWESGSQNRKLNAWQACQALHRYACAFPIGKPRAWLWQGRYEWLSGRPDRAKAAWRKSLAAAERLAMPYEQALALSEMSRHF